MSRRNTRSNVGLPAVVLRDRILGYLWQVSVTRQLSGEATEMRASVYSPSLHSTGVGRMSMHQCGVRRVCMALLTNVKLGNCGRVTQAAVRHTTCRSWTGTALGVHVAEAAVVDFWRSQRTEWGIDDGQGDMALWESSACHDCLFETCYPWTCNLKLRRMRNWQCESSSSNCQSSFGVRMSMREEGGYNGKQQSCVFQQVYCLTFVFNMVNVVSIRS